MLKKHCRASVALQRQTPNNQRFSLLVFDFQMCADGELHPQVGLTRLELVTSPLSGVRSNRLSYRPKGVR